MARILGVDVGSVACSLAVVDSNRNVIQTAYSFHHGSIKETMEALLKKIDLSLITAVATTSSTPSVVKMSERYDTQLSVIAAVKEFHPSVGSILFVGGENFGLITFNEKGEYESFRSNSGCAAGTGSFLDQQAKRLNLDSIESLSQIAFCSEGESPKIATRCAVFAKTDLIHAQQEGYSLGQISDGLCEGLAKNIIDTLIPDERVRTPLVLAGGVSANDAVVKHIKEQLQTEPIVGKWSQFFGAIGAALNFLDSGVSETETINDISDVIQLEDKEKTYSYPPLKLELSDYPDFNSLERFLHPVDEGINVEVDIYENLNPTENVCLGIDIGSTSTKAVLLNKENKVLIGLYTKTSGVPVKAMQHILKTIDHISSSKDVKFTVSAVGTTGSGRKFIGKLIGADLIVDEITAHARAACELSSDVDTILEIGGQDAKFTTLKDGMVTSSIMNNVCAAGTGSFIEEQAQKLGCPLSEYADRAIGKSSPATSDRCTVFMERDINRYLSEGYGVDELLASVLHAVRENYLSKVAVEASIGDKIFFQGATAKNRALIAAFEQKLKKPIMVSRFCHLTGAIGAALILSEKEYQASKFRGINLYKEEIPSETEVCELCANNCKINKLSVQGETVAFGFLCGRDYDTKKFVDSRKESFDLLQHYRKLSAVTNCPASFTSNITVGIPESLYLHEDSAMWEHFFNSLGIKTISSRKAKDPIKTGKKISQAEFCAPVSAFHGHVSYLTDKADYIFLPAYIEDREKEKGSLRQYCYYSQYAPVLVSNIKAVDLGNRKITPVIDSRKYTVRTELYKALKPIFNLSYWSVYSAYENALQFHRETKEKLKNVFEREFNPKSDINVVLLGRPYTVLSETMNKSIPSIFSKLGIKSFYQDMVESTPVEIEKLEPLMKAVHWNHASKILQKSLSTARENGLYPILITSFKCGPDSFIIEYFRRIMDAFKKPYLILELDEHDSSVGYETRIEAAVRSFRNHHSGEKKRPHIKHGKKQSTYQMLKNSVFNYGNIDEFTDEEEKLFDNAPLPVNPVIKSKVDGKTLLFPSWDEYSAKLIEALLLREGVDARMVPLTHSAIQKGPSTNSGQCLPVNIIFQSYVDYIKDNNLDPSQVVVWMFDSVLSCNIPMYPYFIGNMLEKLGDGMEKVEMYIGEITFSDISFQTAIDAYFAYSFGGMLRKIGCRIRPYEVEKGATDNAINEARRILYNTFLGNRSKEDDLIKVVSLFKKIKTKIIKKPRVAIFGDMYARDNDLFNQNLIKSIEDAGGEVVTTPFSDLVKMIADPTFKRWFRMGMYKDVITGKSIQTLVTALEKSYNRIFSELIPEESGTPEVDIEKIIDTYGVKIEHSGESFDNLVKIYRLIEHYPNISLFVQANPAFCCAGLVSEALAANIEKETGIPIAILTYDGTEKYQNDKIIPYIKFPRKRV